jgi:hypothetical protein
MVWTFQLGLVSLALIYPGKITPNPQLISKGLIEISYTFLSEVILTVVIILIVHPKFTGSLLNRLYHVINPAYRGYWLVEDKLELIEKK